VIAEFFATLVFVQFSIGASVAVEVMPISLSPALAQIFITGFHFLLILMVIYGFAAISGAHFNPSVTISVLFTRRVTLLRAVLYVVAQVIGGIAGAGFQLLATQSQFKDLIQAPSGLFGANSGQVFCAELFVTFGLVFGTYANAFDPRGWGKLGPLAIALIVFINIFVASYISGGVMNPIRAFAPGVVQGHFESDIWAYLVGPIVGGVFGAVVYEYLFMFREHSRPQDVPSTSGDNHPKAKRE